MAAVRRYQGTLYDSNRWDGFELRPGDIIIAAPPKCGTTWTQMICALLILQEPELTLPLDTLSPWIDMVTRARTEVFADLQAQSHRRFIKTHTPLDGVPLDARATYIVVARHPLDMAVSLYHHSANIDRARMRQLTGQPGSLYEASPRPSLREWVLRWIGAVVSPRDELDSLPGVMLHLSDAWARRTRPGVVLVRYDDLSADLEGEMRRLAELLGRPELTARQFDADQETLAAELASIFAARPLAEWLELFDAEDVCVGPVATIAEAGSDLA